MSSVVGTIGAVGQMGLQALENEPLRLQRESDRCSEEGRLLIRFRLKKMENFF